VLLPHVVAGHVIGERQLLVGRHAGKLTLMTEITQVCVISVIHAQE
jgi:hypothetical protein